ncbi:MAG: redoxin domain-containing protein [SAR324 cluster bacterium]|nr:redoxin domain-containing protein [SAR324 cluster bacterium]
MFTTSIKFWGAVAIILGFIGILAYGLNKDPKKVPSPLINKEAADFEVSSLGGTSSLRLSDLRGKPVILNFWASWCVECQTEAHVLESFYQQYDKKKQQIRVIGIAIQDTPERANAFANQFGKNYFLALDYEDGRIALDYGIYGVPETFFIDARGIIRFKKVGGVTPQLMTQQIQTLLRSSATDG